MISFRVVPIYTLESESELEAQLADISNQFKNSFYDALVQSNHCKKHVV